MKTMKKLFSIVLVLALVLSLGISAMASTAAVDPTPATPNDVTITIEEKDTEVEHIYRVYQIFSGTQNLNSTEKDKHQPLASIEWGRGVNGEELLQDLKSNEKDPINEAFKSCNDAASVAEVLSKHLNEDNFANAFAAIVNKHLTKGPLDYYVVTSDGKNDTRFKVPVGYYLFKDVTDLNGKDDASNALILQATTDITVEVKYDVPSSEKTMGDINDTTEQGVNTGKNTGDWDIGDKIPYELKATISDQNYAAYETFELDFVDTMCEGLTYNNDAKITWTDESEVVHDITKAFNLSWAPYSGSDLIYENCTVYTWHCEDIKKIVGSEGTTVSIPAGATICVNYTATLNNKAKIGSTGNPNEYYIEFSNNPSTESHGKTPEQKVTAFTFELDVNKVDGDNHPLSDAGFTLYKLLPSAKASAQAVPATENELQDPEVSSQIGTQMDGYSWEVVKVIEPADDQTTFEFKGIDDGVYKLEESAVPAGYNKADDIIFNIVAEHDNVGGIDTVTKLNFNGLSMTGDISNLSDNFTATINVVNQQGLELPETGGIGTTILYVVGGVLVAVAVIFLITKKRMGKAQR